MRGKVKLTHTTATQPRITPACAGKSSRKASRSRAGEDHPRLCGEKGNAKGRGYPRPGSPPPVRGKDSKSHIHGVNAGITPACAGKRDRAPSRMHYRGDHPRLCGEKTKRSSKSRHFTIPKIKFHLVCSQLLSINDNRLKPCASVLH